VLFGYDFAHVNNQPYCAGVYTNRISYKNPELVDEELEAKVNAAIHADNQQAVYDYNGVKTKPVLLLYKNTFINLTINEKKLYSRSFKLTNKEFNYVEPDFLEILKNDVKMVDIFNIKNRKRLGRKA
jgi:DNA-binding transcriptional regulator of glucitol operon